MQCPRCRHESRTAGKFCPECGAPLTHLRNGQIKAARREGQRTYDVSLAQEERAYHAYAARILGDIAAAGGGGNPENYFSEAIEIASRFGMRPLLAQCDLGLGAWHRQLGDHARARARLTTAVSALRSLRLPCGSIRRRRS